MVDLDLRQLRYLVAVGDKGSYTRAAEALTMTQPALSRAIAALERAVGVKLVDRMPRGVALTSAGKALADEARVILDQIGLAVEQSRQIAAVPLPLRVSARGCDLVILHNLIRAYERSHPGERAEPTEADWHSQLDELRTGATRVALVSGDIDGSGLEIEVLTRCERVALVSANHGLATRQVVDRAELLPDPVVTWVGNSPPERAYWLGSTGVDRDIVAGPEVNDPLKLIAQVRLGAAIAFLPRYHVEHCVMPKDVVTLRVKGLSPAPVQLVWRERETSLAVARFVRQATEMYALGSDSHGFAEPLDSRATGRDQSAANNRDPLSRADART